MISVAYHKAITLVPNPPTNSNRKIRTYEENCIPSVKRQMLPANKYCKVKHCGNVKKSFLSTL